MSDFDSSLPIRTQNAGDVISKIADATTPSQQLKVNVDGSIDANVSATNLDIRDLSASQDNVAISDGTDTLAINADGSINSVVTATNLDIRDLAFATDKVDVSGSSVTVSATDLDIRDLAFATDKVDVSGSTLGANSGVDIGDVTVNNGAGAAAVNIQDGGNSITVDGSVTVSATDLDIRDLAFATDKVDVSGSSVTVSATDLDIRDLSHVTDSVKIGDGTDFLAVNANGSINVVVADSGGNEINNYNAATAVASNATSNHDYTVTAGQTLQLQQIEASASGKAKIDVRIETGVATGVFNTVFTQFNSTAEPNMSICLKAPISVAAGVRVRVVRTNRENQAQDLYSTISGVENP